MLVCSWFTCSFGAAVPSASSAAETLGCCTTFSDCEARAESTVLLVSAEDFAAFVSAGAGDCAPEETPNACALVASICVTFSLESGGPGGRVLEAACCLFVSPRPSLDEGAGAPPAADGRCGLLPSLLPKPSTGAGAAGGLDGGEAD